MTPRWKSHLGASALTFDVLVWCIAENRLPARSRLWRGQFTDVAAARCAGAEAAARQDRHDAQDGSDSLLPHRAVPPFAGSLFVMFSGWLRNMVEGRHSG